MKMATDDYGYYMDSVATDAQQQSNTIFSVLDNILPTITDVAGKILPVWAANQLARPDDTYRYTLPYNGIANNQQRNTGIIAGMDNKNLLLIGAGVLLLVILIAKRG